MSGEVVEARNLTFRYDLTPALEEVSFTIREGDFVSVIGPNGAGKTTLAKILLGLLLPTSGTVRVLGRLPRQVSGQLGYVPQYTSFDQQFPIRVLDVILMGRLTKPFGFYSAADRRAARDALEEVDMSELADRPFSALSGGQRQRVLIARALAGQPRILLMDEPTTNVDTAAEDKMKRLLKALNRRMTIILVTHDLGFVPEMVNKVLCVNVGARLHETREVSEAMIRELFHGKMRMVKHDLREDEAGHDGAGGGASVLPTDEEAHRV